MYNTHIFLSLDVNLVRFRLLYMKYVKEEDIEKIKNGELGPLGEIYSAIYLDCLNFMIKSFNCTTDDAHDAVMDAFIVFVLKIKQGTYKNENLKSFVCKVSKNIWLNKNKRDSKFKDLDPKSLEYLLVDTSQSEESESAKELLKNAIAAINAMSKKCNQILTLTLLEGHSLDTVTERLKYKNKEVLKSMKSRCLKKLLEMLNM